MDIQERKDLKGANLQGADLIEANLKGANVHVHRPLAVNFI